MDKQVCFSSNNFSFITTFVCLLIGVLVYQIYNMSQQFLINFKKETNTPQPITIIQKTPVTPEKHDTQPVTKQILDNIYNPLVPPNRLYPGGRLNMSNRFDNYQMVGFLSSIINPNIRYPLFGRYKYSGRSDRWEYYLLDESRNRIKIPIKIKNDEELYDGDKQFINELSDEFLVTLYKFNDFDYRDTL